MTDTAHLTVLGQHALVRSSDAPLIEGVRRAWSACARLPSDDAPDVELDVQSEAGEIRAALEQVTQQLTLAAIGNLAGQALMLHACAVADPEGLRCVALVGPSGVGKTTLATLLGRQWRYVTDECVAIDSDGLVVPFPKPLSVIESGPVKSQLPPELLGLRHATERTELVGLVLLHRVSSAIGSVEVPSTPRAVAMLAEHTSYLSALDGPLARMAGVVHSAGGLHAATYSDSQEIVSLVDVLFGKRR